VRMSASAAVRSGEQVASGPGSDGRPEAVRALCVARWGLLPPWATERRAGARMINARAETVATTRAYARPFATHRCLIPATGWYEFAPLPATSPVPARRKQAYFMTPGDGAPLVLAGLWSVWGPPEERVLTCSIVTMPAAGDLRSVHDRMPLFLGRDRWEPWLTGPANPADLLRSPSDADLASIEIRPVGPEVGNVKSDGPELIQRTDPITTVKPVDLTLF